MNRLILLAALVCLSGCARFSIVQTDSSPDERIIETRIKGTAWFSSAQNISNLKAVQTDKTQSFGSTGIGQQGETNIVAILNALGGVLQTLRPTP